MATPCKSCEQLVEELAELRRRLAEAEDGRLRGLLDGLAATDVGVDIIGADHRILYQNSVLAGRFGDVTGKLCYESYCGRREPCEACPMIRSLATGGVERAELTGLDGRRYEVLAAPLAGPDGTADRAIKLVQDITERKRAEEALRASERRYRTLVEDLPALVCRFRRDGTLTFVNDAYCTYFGKPREKLIGRSFFQFIPPAERAHVRRRYESLTPERPFVTYEHKVVGPDGAVGYQRWADRLMTAEGAEGQEYQSVGFDITERKREEEALRESERFSTSLLESAPHPIIAIEADTSVRYVNPALEKLTGFSAEEIVGVKAPYPWWTPDTLEKTGRDLQKVLREGAVRLEEVFQNKAGERFWVEITSLSVADKGMPGCYLANWVDVTERKRAEEALRASERRLRSVFQAASSVAFVTTDLQGVDAHILDFSPGAERIFGYSREEVVGQPLAILHVPEDVELFPKVIEAVRRRGKGLTDEVQLVRKSGQRFPALLTVLPMRDDAGDMVGLLGVSIDITERKAAEADLRLQSTILARISDVVIATDLERRITFVNEKVCEALRRSREELVGQSVELLGEVPGGGATQREIIERTRIDGAWQGEVVNVTADGQEVILDCRTQLLRNDAGQPIGIVGVSTDVTDRKRAEKALRESEARFRSLFEHAPLGYQSLGADGRIVHVNRAWLDTLGYERQDEVVGRSLGDFLAPDEASHFAAAYARFAEAGAVHSVEWEMLRKDGTRIVALLNGRAVEDAEGRFQNMHCTVQDITARKRAERNLARRAEILSRQVQERYDMVGESPPMQALYEFIHKAAPTEAGVFICGESGVGKEMVARAVHNNSHRSHGPLEIVNCGAIPVGLLDSELFGHVRGAFTGAVADKPGRFELADGGTLFLDEITTMPLECQAKLLRVIEEGKVRRIGATRDRAVSVRLMAATNSDPAQAVAAGILREDLFYRLDRLRVVVPPLRQRADDIPLLAEHFLEVCSASLKGKVNSFDPEVHEVFRAYRWPGNVRELRNVVERMVILADGPELGLDLVPGDLRRAADSPKDHDVQSLDEIARQQIVRALDEADGNKSRAARILGIDRSTLYAKLRHYGMLR